MIKNDEGVPSKNQKLLSSFVEYCLEHPDERFWQALRNWSVKAFVLTADSFDDSSNYGRYIGLKDTFYE